MYIITQKDSVEQNAAIGVGDSMNRASEVKCKNAKK